MATFALPRFGASRHAVPPLPVWTFCYENVLGTSFEVRVRATSESAAYRAEYRALTEIDRLETVFSSFRANSEFRRWQDARGEPWQLSPELLTVLRACDVWRERSGNALHPASEAFTRLWRGAEQRGTVPTPEERAAVWERAMQTPWQDGPEPDTVTCLTDVPLTLNALAKGFIVDAALAAALAEPEVRGVLLSIGGDLRIGGDAEECVGIADPNQTAADNAAPFTAVRLRNASLATSGDTRRGFQVGGSWYSHVLDPRTGWPASEIRSASVIAPTTMEADALATVAGVLTPAESLPMIEATPNAACLLIAFDGRQYRSRRWRAFEV